MNILVTNDDGIDSPGLADLAHAFESIGNVSVVAPASQQSAVGHALTIENPLRAHNFHLNGLKFGIAVNGTPSDCVKLAISALLDNKPDLVISGVNFGRNTSINIIYSGTVAAATEGMLLGIPSIAVSLDSFSRKSSTKTAAKFALDIVKNLKDTPIPKGTLLNINVPDLPENEIKAKVITRLSKSEWVDKYEKRTDPFNREYYWFDGEYIVPENSLDTDDYALSQGYVTVTPIEFNFTNLSFIRKLNNSNNFNK